MITAVLFDYGGVLTEGGTSGGLLRLVANTMQVPLKEASRAREPLIQLLLGKLTPAEFLQELARIYPDSPKPTQQTLLDNAEIFSRSRPVYELADELRARGIRTAILSNMFEPSATQLRENGFYDGFDPVVLSCEEHTGKPGQAVYRRALEKLGVPAAEVLFIDDQQRFLDPAKAMGMHVLLAQSPEQIVADTRRIVFGEEPEGKRA